MTPHRTAAGPHRPGGGGGVRITGGSARGRVLAVPATARPTSSRVREAVFSHWQDVVPGARFLDLFAGSGVTGAEAASRGAAEVVWVEVDRRAAEGIGRIRAALGLAGTVRNGDALRVLEELDDAGSSFDLVYADPPYGYADHAAVLAALTSLLSGEGEIAIEHASRDAVPEPPAGLELVARRRYGDTMISFFRRSPAG